MRVLRVNWRRRVGDTWGCGRIGQTPRILKSNRHDRAFYVAMWQDLNTHGRWKGDIWNRRKDGEVYLERITITAIRGSAGGSVRYVSVFSDITDLWRKDEFLKRLAFHDALTDLPNRSLLFSLLHKERVFPFPSDVPHSPLPQ